MDLSTIALQGLEQADALLNTAAGNLAVAGTGSATGAGINGVDMTSDVVSLMSAQILFEANAETLKTANQLEQSLLNVVG